jgi:hypothetical protein
MLADLQGKSQANHFTFTFVQGLESIFTNLAKGKKHKYLRMS